MNKIGIFIGSMEGGGAERVVLNLANEFQERKIPIVLILRFKKGPYLRNLNPKIEVVTLNSKNSIICVFQLIKVCKKNNIKSILSVSRFNNVLTLIACLFINIKVVIREAATFDNLFTSNGFKAFKNYFILYSMKYLYPKADKVIANSEGTASDIKKHIKLKHEKLIVINNPLVNHDIIKYSNKSIGELFFRKCSKPIIISVGRLFRQKNFNLLINSFSVVKKQIQSASLIILGDGPQQNQLISLSKELGIDDSVHLPGFVRNPYKFLKHSDVFVLSSLYEGFGNVLVEALAVGLPIVSTNCQGGPREILNNGEFGLLVPINDINAMAEAIIETLNTKHDNSLLIKRANLYSIDKIASEYYKILEP